VTSSWSFIRQLFHTEFKNIFLLYLVLQIMLNVTTGGLLQSLRTHKDEIKVQPHTY